MGAVPKNNGTTFVSKTMDVLIEKINEDKWR